MSDAVYALVGSVITGLLLYAGTVYQARKSNDALYAKLDKQSELSDAKMQGEIDLIKSEVTSLRQEVERHNGLIERTYKLERDYAVLENKVKVADNRISDLEKVKAG